MQDADGPSEPRASDGDDDRAGFSDESKPDLAALQARVERLLDPSNVTSTSSSAVESAAQASVITSAVARAEPGEGRSRVPVGSQHREAGHSDLAARLREMEGSARPHPAGLGLESRRTGPGSGPSFDDLRRAISEELPEHGGADEHGDDHYRDVEDMKAALIDGDDHPFRRTYDDEDATGEAEAIDPHAYRTRVRIVVLIQVAAAIACGLLALLHVTGNI